jgi:hypothetical protein
MSPADAAIVYLLRRIKEDPRVAYYFAHTESLKLLIDAHAAVNGLDAKAFYREFESYLRTEAPRCRPGQCCLHEVTMSAS